jgi:hypothetical protein
VEADVEEVEEASAEQTGSDRDSICLLPSLERKKKKRKEKGKKSKCYMPFEKAWAQLHFISHVC